MPNSNNKVRQSLKINFSASHDQASVQDESASNYKNLNAIIPTLEKIQEDLQIDSETHSPEKLQKQLNEMNETKTEVINLVKYARQIVNDLQEGTKKLSTIQQHSSDEKLRHAKSLLPTHKPLTANEKYRFKEIEEALSNTCIIKSAGDETVKFQLGILGYAKDSNIISESEFNYLVVARLKENNLLDSYRLRVKKDMILKRTSLEICQSINEGLSSDPDYEDSKNLLVHRLKGIDYELSLHNCNNELPRDVTQLQEELMSGVLAHGSTNTSAQNFEDHFEGELLLLPEIPADSVELNSQQSSAELIKKIEPSVEHAHKSKFVAIMEELIPANKKNEIHIDEISPIPVEKIMKITLQRPSQLSEEEKRKLNYSMIMKAEKITGKAVAKVQENIEDPSYSNDGSYVYTGMMESLTKLKERHAEQLQETKPCQLTGEKLVNEYYKLGKRSLEAKIQKIEKQKDKLEYNKKNKFAEFDKNRQQYRLKSNYEIREEREQIYQTEKKKLDTELEKTMKQQALWEGHETFTQNIYEKNKIKQEKKPFSKEELEFRNRVLNFDSSHTSENKTINVYQDGVHLVSNKKTEDTQPPSIQISNTRASFKNCIQGQTSSSFYSEQNKKEKNPKQLAVGMSSFRS